MLHMTWIPCPPSPRHYPYGHNTMGYLHLNIFLESELYLLTLHKRHVGHGNHGSPSESFFVTATAINCVGWQNDNAFAYHFKFREKWLMQRLRLNVLHLPSTALFWRWQSWRIKVLDKLRRQPTRSDSWYGREKLSNVNVVMRNVNNSV